MSFWQWSRDLMGQRAAQALKWLNMYKNTRHVRTSWTYKQVSASANERGSSLFTTREEALKALKNCRATLSRLKLLEPSEFHLNVRGIIAELDETVIHVMSQRKRNGMANLAKEWCVPATVLATVPDYLLVAPRLRIVMRRLAALDTISVPSELEDLCAHVRRHVDQLALVRASQRAQPVVQTAATRPPARVVVVASGTLLSSPLAKR